MHCVLADNVAVYKNDVKLQTQSKTVSSVTVNVTAGSHRVTHKKEGKGQLGLSEWQGQFETRSFEQG